MNKIDHLHWSYPSPFERYWNIEKHHIDHYQHVNNVAYLAQLESLAWQHSNALGLSFEHYKKLNRAMVIQKHQLSYHKPLYINERVACATWIIKCDKKFKLSRYFEFISLQSHNKVFSAYTDFICCALDTGRPKHMPLDFIKIYGTACLEENKQDKR